MSPLSSATFLTAPTSKDSRVSCGKRYQGCPSPNNVHSPIHPQELVPTILINNAGIWNGGKRLGELQDEQIERVINVNMMAPFWITRAFLPAMLKARHGRIVNVSSVLGLGGVAKMSMLLF